MRYTIVLASGIALLLALTAPEAVAAGPATPAKKPQPVAGKGGKAAKEADAQPAPSPFVELLAGVSWGMTHEQLMAFFEQRIWKEFDERKKKMTDVLDIDKARRRTADDVTKMRAEYVELKPENQAYRVSIIETEFKLGTGESVFRIDDVDVQRYFFFINDKLWKIFSAYNSTHVRQTPFDAYLQAMVDKYGEPAKRNKEMRKVNKTSAEVLAEVIWEDPTFRVRVQDQTPFFGTYTLAVTSRETEDRIQELRGEVRGLETQAEPSDPSMKSLIGDSVAPTTDNPDSDIIDTILGEKTKVDVVKEMPLTEDEFKPAAPTPSKGKPGPAPPQGKEQPTPQGSQPAVDSKGPIIY